MTGNDELPETLPEANDASTSSGTSTFYRFVDGTNPDMTVVKRHVMRNHIDSLRAGRQGFHKVKTSANSRSNRRGRESISRPLNKKRKRGARTPHSTTRQNPKSTSDVSGAFELGVEEDTSSKDVSESTDPFSFESSSAESARCLEITETVKTNKQKTRTRSIVINSSSESYQDSGEESQWGLIVRFSHAEINSSDVAYPSLGTSPFPPSLSSLSPSPQTMLSAAWTDPFNTLPMKLTEKDEALFHFYVNVMPACSYGFNVLPPKAHNWYNEVFVPEAMKGEICFKNTILVHAANTQAWVSGLDETPETIYYRAMGVKALLKHRVEAPHDFSDAVISATLSAAAVEDFDPREERKEASWFHMRGAMAMIRKRGGPAAFKENRRMAMLINWSDYIFAGYSTDPQTSSFYFEPTSPASSASSQTGTYPDLPCLFNPINEIESECETFIKFLRRSEQLAINSNLSQLGKVSPRRWLSFGRNTLLFKILSSPPGLRYYSKPGTRKQYISRLAALMMINAALWEYRLLPEKSDRFLKGLSMKLLEKDVDLNESVEALLQILLAHDDTFGIPELEQEDDTERRADRDTIVLDPETGGYFTRREIRARVDPYERPWFVGRMLKIAKRLGLASWVALNELLLSFLTLEARGSEVARLEGSLRSEVLSAPLTMLIMPVSRVDDNV